MNIIFDLFLDLFASKIVYCGFLLFKKMLAGSIRAFDSGRLGRVIDQITSLARATKKVVCFPL